MFFFFFYVRLPKDNLEDGDQISPVYRETCKDSGTLATSFVPHPIVHKGMKQKETQIWMEASSWSKGAVEVG